MILDALSPARRRSRSESESHEEAGRGALHDQSHLHTVKLSPGSGADAIPSFFTPAPPTSTTDPSTDGGVGAPWAATLGPRAASFLLTAPALDALWAAVRGRAVVAARVALAGEDDDGALSEGVLDYEAYRQAATDALASAGPAAARLLTARAFLRLAAAATATAPTTPPGTVPAAALIAYLGQRAGSLQMHVHLACFARCGGGPGAGGGDGDGGDPSTPSFSEGWLDADAVAAFVADTLPQLAGSGAGAAFPGALPPAEHAALASRKLTFFHGARPAHGCGGTPGGRVRVRGLLAGAPLAELLDLHRAPGAVAAFPEEDQEQQEGRPPACGGGGGGGDHSPHATVGGPLDNWFSAASTARVAALFADLCGGEGGAGGDGARARARARARAGHPPSIAAAGLARLNGGTLSPLFAARLVEERGSAPGGGLALPDFVDFLLAWADRGSPASLRWLWPALDVRGAGHLTRADVHTLFDAVRALWVERGQYPELRTEDVVCEVFDMLAPARPDVLTLGDLVRRGRGGGYGPAPPAPGAGAWGAGAGTGGTVAGAVVGLLADVSCFWEHDSREAALQAAALAGQQQQQQQQRQQQQAAAAAAAAVEGEGEARTTAGEAVPPPGAGTTATTSPADATSPARPWADVDPGWGGGEVGGRHETLRERAVRRAATAAAAAAAAGGAARPPQHGSPPPGSGLPPAPPATSPWAFASSPGSPSDSVGSEAWSDGFAVAGDDTPPQQGGGGSSSGWGEAAAGG